MDERAPPLRLVCSDELGQLKVVQTADGAQLGTAALAATWGQPDKLQAIDCLDLGSNGGVEDIQTAVLAVARCHGAIELLSPITGQLLGSIPPATPLPSSASKQQQDAVRIRGLHLLWDQSGSQLPAVLSVTQGGAARLHTPAAQQPNGSSSWEQQRSWQVPPEVCCTAYDPASGRLAVGCQGAELRLFDAATGELVFAFKGGKPNKVGLVDKPWNTAIAFLPPAPGGSSGGASSSSSSSEQPGPAASGSRLLVGTGHHKVRLYDSDAGKRPQMELTWGETRITCLALEPNGQRCWVGNGLGQLEVLDLQAQRFSGAIKGLAGSARSLAVHPSGEVVASVCLDRSLRLHSTDSRKLLAKVYCKTLPSGLAFCPTDASMLPPLEKKEQGADGREERRRKKQKQKKQRRRDESEEGEGSEEDQQQEESGSEAEADEEDSEAEERRRRRKQQRRSSKQQRGSGGKRERRGRRPATGGDD